jgi:hypothetical protein
VWTTIAIFMQPARRIVVSLVINLASGLAVLAYAVLLGLTTRTPHGLRRSSRS